MVVPLIASFDMLDTFLVAPILAISVAAAVA